MKTITTLLLLLLASPSLLAEPEHWVFDVSWALAQEEEGEVDFDAVGDAATNMVFQCEGLMTGTGLFLPVIIAMAEQDGEQTENREKLREVLENSDLTEVFYDGTINFLMLFIDRYGQRFPGTAFEAKMDLKFSYASDYFIDPRIQYSDEIFDNNDSYGSKILVEAQMCIDLMEFLNEEWADHPQWGGM